MSTQISYNSFDLQDTVFKTSNILYRNLPDKVVNILPQSRRDGFFLQSTYYTKKDINIVGSITRDSAANLKTSIDSMKEALHKNESNLDIIEGGVTTRWVCSVSSIDVPEKNYNLAQVPFNISFVCQPLGSATSSTNDSKTITNASASPYVNTFNPVGSAPPLPTLKWTCSGAPTAAITQIVFANINTGTSMTVASLALDANGDYLEIDCDNMTVKVSHDGGAASAIDFSGVFPTFLATSNSYNLTITGGSTTWALDQDIDYYAKYL